MSLHGRTAIVTGAARGLGRAIALGLASAGARVVAVDRPGAAGLDAFEHAHGFDLADTHGLAGLADDIHAAHGPIHILVNNAGVARLEHFNEITVEAWREVMLVNADAVFFLSQRVAEHMIADGVPGRIISISSKNGLMAEAGLAHYNASKGAVELITKSLAAELGPHGVTVNGVAPGMIATPIDGEFPLDREPFEAAWNERIPLRDGHGGGYGRPEDVVGAVLYLASDAARYVTGTTLVVDGGVLADQMPRLRFMRPYRNSLET
ncbi:SDR family NAD(P)-dependent oxidoreductase [Actinoallomurus iriomotensis]|uniref:Gluconate 5-dehydrogenase n=1 Tax=Actinoallomurus iriomotensis TaxID=478107 RepID=A0A9W6VZU1_9ACTN|nr:SDR family oxidoreductase [Actinoallomurus iriomotensis]GLY85704.1 gluconate 5-dehydrogenase [Actinoallomurus iriomotensis]